jgi:hypothetical protein
MWSVSKIFGNMVIKKSIKGANKIIRSVSNKFKAAHFIREKEILL